MKYSRVNAAQLPSTLYGAGVVLKDINTTNWTYKNSDVLCVTSGGIRFSSTYETVDMGANIDNCPKNTMQLKKVRPQSGTTTLSFTAASADADSLVKFIGTASYDSATHKVTPRNDILTTDFGSLWFCVDTAGGGGLIFHIANALSTGGLSISTKDNDTGTSSVTITAHYDINNLVEEPFEIYVVEGGSDILNSTTQMWTGDGTKTEFTFTKTPVSVNSITVDGTEKTVTTDYTVATNKLTFTEAPTDGAVIVADFNYALGT